MSMAVEAKDSYDVMLLPGDGIGPEITAATMEALEPLQSLFKINFKEVVPYCIVDTNAVKRSFCFCDAAVDTEHGIGVCSRWMCLSPQGNETTNLPLRIWVLKKYHQYSVIIIINTVLLLLFLSFLYYL